MNNELMNRAQLLAENTKRMKEEFHWEYTMMYPICANMYTVEGRQLDTDKIKECKKIMKSQVGLFSSFTGTVQIALATLLSMEEEPEILFTKVHTVYKSLREEFYASQYLPLAAYMITKMCDAKEQERVVKRTRKIYDRMKKEHPFLTSSEDATYAALFALSELSDEQAVLEMERCYQLLKTEFFQSNAVQSLSHVLALMDQESAHIKTKRTLELYDKLKEHGCRYGTGYELATLGIVAVTNDNVEKTVQDMIELEAYLKGQKGFGGWSVSKKQRLMYAAMLISSETMKSCADSNTMNATVLNSVTGLIIAEQAAMCACIAASSAAAASSASN